MTGSTTDGLWLGLAQVAALQPSRKYPNLRQVSHVLVENLYSPSGVSVDLDGV